MTRDALSLFSSWSGGLGRPLIGNYASQPAHLALRGDRLLYSAERHLRQLDAGRLLDEFVALADADQTNQDVLDFAKRYGPLYLCEHHGIAAYHQPLLMSSSLSPLGPAAIAGVDEPFKYTWCGPRVEHSRSKTFSEPIERWRQLAARAKNFLLAAHTVRVKGDVEAQLWEKVDGFKEGSFRGWEYLYEPWNRLAANLDYWISAADVHLRMRAEEHSLVAFLGSNPLINSAFGLVAIQLLLAITRSEGLTTCAGCGAPFSSSRQPLAGKRVGRSIAKRNYCQSCRERKVPQRDAARDYRKRCRRTKS